MVSTFDVLSHCQVSAAGQEANDRKHPDLLQDLGEGGLVDLDELLQLVQVVAEQAEPFVKGDIARG